MVGEFKDEISLLILFFFNYVSSVQSSGKFFLK